MTPRCRRMRQALPAVLLLAADDQRSFRPRLRPRLCPALADRPLHRRWRNCRRRQLPCAHLVASRARSAALPRRGCRCFRCAAARGRSSAFFPFSLFWRLLAAGFAGSRDPLSNPLPLTIWTLLWVGLTLVQGIVGNVWAWIDPLYGPYRLARRLGLPALVRLPARLGYWPAVIQFAGFAWFELIDPAPDDPARLAAVGLRLSGGQPRGDADLRPSRLEPARRIPVRLLRHDLGLRDPAERRGDQGRAAISTRPARRKTRRRQPASAERRGVPAAGAVVGVVRRPVAHLLLARLERRQSARISRPHRDDGDQHRRPGSGLRRVGRGLSAWRC